jgi:hypothetical protein
MARERPRDGHAAPPGPQILRPLSAYTAPLLSEPAPLEAEGGAEAAGWRCGTAALRLAAVALRFEAANRRRRGGCTSIAPFLHSSSKRVWIHVLVRVGVWMRVEVR